MNLSAKCCDAYKKDKAVDSHQIFMDCQTPGQKIPTLPTFWQVVSPLLGRTAGVPGNPQQSLLFRVVLREVPGKIEPLGFASVYQTRLSIE